MADWVDDMAYKPLKDWLTDILYGDYGLYS